MVFWVIFKLKGLQSYKVYSISSVSKRSAIELEEQKVLGMSVWKMITPNFFLCLCSSDTFNYLHLLSCHVYKVAGVS